ncbi:uncharacterized protein LOC111473496 [Cucurbita maxima]|uniref:Uncharacterized protein LOC111473496 n=1 Tax=Cucurbita maxima TaxID=3661 RepID=A0A6J1IET5_CUCMA|nr:uncharacterized protein LOC111473496 [Cucurbita maxima]
MASTNSIKCLTVEDVLPSHFTSNTFSTDYVPTVLCDFSANVLVNRQFLIRDSRTLLHNRTSIKCLMLQLRWFLNLHNPRSQIENIPSAMLFDQLTPRSRLCSLLISLDVF